MVRHLKKQPLFGLEITMNRPLSWKSFTVFATVIILVYACGLATNAESPANRPNLIIFLVDDMGWMDSTVYGSQYYDTPNMERLARRSMVFTDAYAANPLCSPTRASIMTGKYPARVGITSAVGHRPPQPRDAPRYPESGSPGQKVLLPESRRFLPPEEYTIAEALRDAGYRTAHLGKWHLGLEPQHWPEEQGFEVSFHGAPDPGPRSYFSPYQFRAGTVTDGPPGEYIADRLTDEALSYIEANSERPFFLNLWHYSVHGPWGHKEELTQTYLDREDPRGRQNNPIMASMLKSMDESLGRVLDKLDQLKLTERTIIIFFSDNGGNVHSEIGPDLLPPTNNFPLRKGKAWLYEGGVRVPMMVHWPGVVESTSRCAEVVVSIDLYPTIMEMLGVPPNPAHTVDGLSLVPVLKGTGKLNREAVFNFFPHGGPSRPAGATVRKGQWKLIRWFDTSLMFPDEHELYNLADDIGETNNLAGQMPEMVGELNGLIDGFFQDTGALAPIPNPNFNPTVRLLGGWVNKNCDVAVADGVLEVSTTRPAAMLAVTGLKCRGPLVVKLRIKADGGTGAVQWRTSRQPKFPDGQLVPFDLPATGQFSDVEVKLPVEGSMVHMRLFLSPRSDSVKIDQIQIATAGGEVPRTWGFDRRAE